jgi:hypothetical protein
MKTFFIILSIITFTSCNNSTFIDKRTDKQINFISYVKALRDTINVSSENKTDRNTLMENSVPAVKSYIRDTLKLVIKSWQVKVIEKTEDYPYKGSILLKTGLAFDPYDTSSGTINQSIILKTIIPASDKAIIEIVKSLKINDYLKIDGQFVQKKGFIDIDSYSHYKFSKNVLDNPEFEAKITSIEKF